MRRFTTFEEIATATNQEIGTSDWLRIDQDRVNAFAEVTGDHQWIHVDVEKAKNGPFSGTIAHGYLSLSLIPFLGNTVFHLATPGPRLNYGVNRSRFPSPLRVGKCVRDRVRFGELTEVASGHQLTVTHTIEIEDGPKPACVAETVLLLLAN